MRFVIRTIGMCISNLFHVQHGDTISVVQQVDSLIEISRQCIKGHDFDMPKAFHAASKELRDIGLDPYNWAEFVLVEKNN